PAQFRLLRYFPTRRSSDLTCADRLIVRCGREKSPCCRILRFVGRADPRSFARSLQDCTTVQRNVAKLSRFAARVGSGVVPAGDRLLHVAVGVVGVEALPVAEAGLTGVDALL